MLDMYFLVFKENTYGPTYHLMIIDTIFGKFYASSSSFPHPLTSNFSLDSSSYHSILFFLIVSVSYFFIYFFCLFFFFAISRATPAAYGGSQARGGIRAVASGLHQSHSNTGSKPHLQPTPQLTAMPDP